MILKTDRRPSAIFTFVIFSIFSFSCLVQSVLAGPEDDIAILSRSSKAFSSVVKKAKPAVVHIQVEKPASRSGRYHNQDEFFNNPFFEHFFGPQFKRQNPQRHKQRGQGSGFIISKDGYILTNNHVVEDAENIRVILNDKQEVKAKLIGTDPQTDVALIKIKHSDDLPTLPLGNSDALEVGEWVIAIGNPFGLSQTVTVGVVSAKGRSQVGINEYENFIQTDAAINPGNSGGPLLNIHGEVVGINSALFSRTGGYMGIGFSIPINMVKAIEDQLQDHGKVTRGWLGVAIQDVTEELAQSFDLAKVQGILISEVQNDSPAEKAGILQGDVLIKLNDMPIADSNDLRNKVAFLIPGSEAELDIVRNGKIKKITVKIGEQPSDFGKISRTVDGKGSLDDFGFTLQNLTTDLAQQFGYKERQGVLISSIEPGNVAAEAGLKPGMLIEEVNKQRVHNLKELKKIIDSSQHPKRILLRIRSGRSAHYVVLKAE